MHYCRLIYKTCKINESKVLIEWLLLNSFSLVRARINQNHAQSIKLVEVIKEYHEKYFQEYHETFSLKKCSVRIDEAISECKNLRKSRNATSGG